MNNNFSKIVGEKRLKISKISQDTGISRTTLTNIYYAQVDNISGRVLVRLCDYLGVTPDELLGIKSNTYSQLKNERR